MKKRFYEKTKACLLSMALFVMASAVPTGALENNPTDYTDTASCYTEQTSLNDVAGSARYGWGIILGDMNGDRKVDLSDVKTALQATLKLDTFTEEQRKSADIDGDGAVTIHDVHNILKKALNVIPDLQAIYNIKQVINYIDKYGEESPDGARFITSGDYSKNNIIYYYPDDNTLEFVQMKIVRSSLKTEYLSAYFTYDISTLSVIDNKITFTASCYDGNYAYDIVSEAYFNSESFCFADDLPFVPTVLEGATGNSTEVYNYANNTTQSAIAAWSSLLLGNCGYGLSNIGFDSYSK